jgi:membrane protein
MQRFATLWRALYQLFENSGFAMAGAVAFSFVLSLFPFCIFLGALAGVFGGESLAKAAVAQLFDVLPVRVAEALAPEVVNVMGQSRFGLLTASAAISLFFATSSVESLRAALNTAYREHETRSYFYCLGRSALFVFVGAVAMLTMAWAVLIGPALAQSFEWIGINFLLGQGWFQFVLRYAIAAGVIVLQLLAYHLWLAGGHRTLAEVLPGIVVSTILWMLLAGLFSRWLEFNNYARFYGTLAQLMSALIYFQLTAMIVMLGAEINRGIMEIRRMRAAGSPLVADW